MGKRSAYEFSMGFGSIVFLGAVVVLAGIGILDVLLGSSDSAVVVDLSCVVENAKQFENSSVMEAIALYEAYKPLSEQWIKTVCG